ncbi:MAG: DUF6270 domain-containing protein [Bacillota bacterium]|nr:DUF6270 domain-containing protein [Bacillota bacterium]
MIEIIGFEVDKSRNLIFLNGLTKDKISYLQLYYQRIKEYKNPIVKIEIPVVQDGENFSAKLSLDELLSKSIKDSSTIWSIVGKSSLEEHIKVTFKKQLKEQLANFEVSPTLNLTFNDNDTGAFKLNLIDISAMVQKIETYNEVSFINGSINQDIYKLGLKVFLRAMRRPSPILYNFHEEEVDIPVELNRLTGNFRVEINWNIFNEDVCIDDKNVWDFVLICEDKYGHQIKSFLNVEKNTNLIGVNNSIELLGSSLTISPYITGSNRLSFYLLKNNKKQVFLSTFSETENYYYFELNYDLPIRHMEVIDLVSKRRDRKGTTFEYSEEVIWEIETKKLIKVSKENFLLDSNTYHESTWDFFIRINDIDYHIMVPDSTLFQSDYIYIKNKKLKSKLFKSPQKGLSCYTILSDDSSRNAVNVAVMGTCFSRNMFNSSLYFNPGYKNTLNCTFTQFHSSIMSIMTQPYKHDLNKYNDMTENEKKFVKEDFEKKFFENLKKSEAEYFVIDLYPDVIRPIIWIDDKTAVTLSYVIEDSQILNDIPVYKISDHINNQSFFNEWKEYADRFINQLIKIIPEEKIILNKGRFTTLYYDKQKQKKEFPNKMMIERNNYFWDKLDNYFLKQLPRAKYVDINNKGYIGDETYPYGNSFSHYESSYYKDLFKEISFLILNDKLMN